MTAYARNNANSVGVAFYKAIAAQYATDDLGKMEASRALLSAGIRGIRYLDGNSRSQQFSVRGAGDYHTIINSTNGQKAEEFEDADSYEKAKAKADELNGSSSYNYVIFDEADITITEENGQPVDTGTTSFSIGRKAATFQEAREAAQEFIGKPITNLDDGTSATVSSNSLRKILQNKASSKSISPQVHAFMAANMDTLFARGIRAFTDSNPEEQNLAARHRYHSPFIANGEMILGKLTVLEFKEASDGARLYSVEALEIVKPETFKASSISENRRNYNRVAGFENKLESRIQEVNRAG